MPQKKKKPVAKKKATAKPAKPKEAAAPADVVEVKKPKGPGATPQTPRGMKDILPVDEKYWRFIERSTGSLADAYGFRRIETPILEDTALFARGVGKQTDIVEKEMFTFIDRGGESLTLRPEGTAPVVRAYIHHGMLNLPQPVKLWYAGPMFRHERPQGGRLRQFHQMSYETLGEAKPIVDAELILIAMRFFKDCGLPVTLEINSIGDAKCRPGYTEKLVNYFRSHRSALCDTCKVRLTKNPLRILDCKEDGCHALKAEAPQTLDNLCDDCKNHFMKVLEYLGDAEVSYNLNPALVRGLDYYTRTVFEIMPESPDAAAKAQSALASGGRYDGLAETLGGRATPGAGFSIGIERVIGRLREDNSVVPEFIPAKIYFAQLGDPAKKRGLVLFEELRTAGIPAVANFTKDSLKQQMEYAAGLGVRYVVILGQKEIMDGTVIIRDMDAGIQETVDQKKLVNDLKKKLGTQLVVAPEPAAVLPPATSMAEIEAAPALHTPRQKRPAAALDEGLDVQDELLEPPIPVGEKEPGVGDDTLGVETIDEVLGPPAGLIEEEP